ncbi:MAG TPA: CocE/NonD family hydrolase [Chitinophagales bacterium]|nr:CocE/NonD family hydrolase [Chitinophagales bacterium]HMY42647.1 CocE/NonD family hydrolase [Chitinophagales bacterium]HMZ68850.1 CocE/NonD family hydrolase [Chitinophagales bacterium]HNC63052.1 CocE/NonD family hydrolase [Chitinophagales bacterium]HNJ59564.1 CocE/NonD family hydrolase [Chitinophagales bacterium]
MRKIIVSFVWVCLLFINLKAQQLNIPNGKLIPAPKVNGTLDDLTDFAQRVQVPFMMPDSTILYTDIYLPILQDSLTFDVTIPIINQDIKLTVLGKGFQYIIYDSINGQLNPNPYQLPMILERTPYNKNGGDVMIGSAMALLGYSAAVQDMRGRYTSQGAYLPLYSDSWKKTPYHNNNHLLDITSPDDPRNGNNHEDGYNTIEFIKNNLVRKFDLDKNGTLETTDLVYNGSIGMFGASALGYNQHQAAAAHKIDPTQPGLKSLFPIVGPLEFYKSTGYHNGCFRNMLVKGWLKGQIYDLEDDKMSIDQGINDSIHTAKDYNLPNKFVAAETAVDHFSTYKYPGSTPGYFPNSINRDNMDGSVAMVDENGEGDKNGKFSRYTNMEVASFQVAGWWDLFVDGQIETNNFARQYLTHKKNLQKIVIGPWAHQTIGSRKTGDKTYPVNVTDFTKVDISNFGDDLDVGSIAESELLTWFRYNLNYFGQNNVGEPKILIPKSNTWQTVVGDLKVQFPAKDYKMKFIDLLNFLLATDGLKQVPVSIKLGNLNPLNININIPKLDDAIVKGISSSKKLESLKKLEYKDIPAYRFYVVGPSDNQGMSLGAGNYWMGADKFPIDDVVWQSLYLHRNNGLSFEMPSEDEGLVSYTDNPNNPIITVGGNNMLVKTPQGDRDSQGQMNLADPNFSSFTMDREGVIKFETDVLSDSLSIIGFPKVKLYAKSNPLNVQNGETDCDFYVRILDVYPDGSEFYVVEGGINARAREWAKSIAEGNENINAPFTNINVGQIYEFFFEMYPIAYTFAEGHKMKVLICSSNYPRFQANPNTPIEDGTFFRRAPNDGKTNIYKGVEYTPRIAVQSVAISDIYDSQIILPIYGATKVISGIRNNPMKKPNFDFNLFPNPSQGEFSIVMDKNGGYNVNIYNLLGQKLINKDIQDQAYFDLKGYPKGNYVMEVIDTKDNSKKQTKLFSIF